MDTTGASTRRSAQDKKKPKLYGDLTEMSSSDESSDNGQASNHRRRISIASYSPPRTTLAETMSPPPHSGIPLTSSSQIQPAENIGIAPQDICEDRAHGDVLTIFEQDQPERSLQPHEF